MCNLYSITIGQRAIREFARAMVDRTGNLPPLPGVFPDYAAPMVRNGVEGRELTMAQWGIPSSQKILLDAATKRAEKLRAKCKEVDFAELLKIKPNAGTTNIRNTKSSHWKLWLGTEHPCVVPFTSFSEFNREAGGDIWFALKESRPPAVFARIWADWTSVRKVREAMPVILTERDAIEAWMTAPWAEAAALQRRLSDGSLQIIARGLHDHRLKRSVSFNGTASMCRG